MTFPERAVALTELKPSTPVRSSSRHRSHTIWTRLAWVEPIWLMLLAPSILFPGRFWVASFQPILVLLLFAFWPMRRLAYGRFTASTPLNGWVALLALWLPVTLYISILPAQSWVAVGYLALGIALFFALVNWPPARKYPVLPLPSILAGGLALALIGPLLLNTRMGSRLFRVAALDARLGLLSERLGEEVNPNVFAGSLVLIIPLALAMLLEPRWSRRRVGPLLCGGVALVGLLSLVVTQSRGAYLSVGVTFVLLAVLRWPRLAWTLPLLVAGTIALVWQVGLTTILDQFSSDTALVGLSGRLEIWERGYWALQDFVFTGVGHGLFHPVVSTLYPFFLLPTDLPHAHNLFLQIGVDMGIVGIAAYGGVVVSGLILAGRTVRRSAAGTVSSADGMRKRAEEGDRGRDIDHEADREEQRQRFLAWAVAAGCLAAVSGMLVHGLVDAVTWGTKLAFIPWMIFAQIVLVEQGPRRRKRRRRRSSAAG